MAGMSTQINLQADAPGEFRGSSANISGKGFADMNFTANAVKQSDFNAWVDAVRKSEKSLSAQEYSSLSEPSIDNPQAYYSSVEPGLFRSVILKFLLPS